MNGKKHVIHKGSEFNSIKSKKKTKLIERNCLTAKVKESFNNGLKKLCDYCSF